MPFQKFPNSKQLSFELESKKLERLYLFLGEEEGEKDKLIEKIIDIAIDNPDEKTYSTRRFHAESDEFSDAMEFALTESMFSKKKICIILNINSLKSKSIEKQQLSEIINNLPKSNILIMTSIENKLPSVIDINDIKKIKVFQFWRFFENDVAGYIITSIRKNSLEIDRAAVNRLIDLTGRDIKKTDEAIEILIETGEKIITEKIILQYIQDTKDVSIFEFIDSLFQKDKTVFPQLVKILDNGIHELVLLKMIMRQAELIEKYNFFISNNLNSESAITEIGIDQRNKKKFLDCAKEFSLDTIKNVFILIHKADQRIKSFNYSNNLTSNPIFELTTEMLLTKSTD